MDICGTVEGTTSFASVAASTSWTSTPGAVSSKVARPSGKPMTASSVTSRWIVREEVSGSVHSRTTFDRPLAVCCMATTTRRAPDTRSIAPPMPGTILPGIIQFASWPRSLTCRPPSTVMSTCPPRISPNDTALSNVHAPGIALTGRPPASVRYRSAIPSSRIGAVPIRPFSDWKKMCMPGGTKFATSVGMPIPRLTSMPSRNSSAIRRAISVWASMLALRDQIVDERCRRHHVIRRNHAHRDDMLGVHDHGVGGHRDDRIEIARGERVGEIAEVIRKKCLEEREVGPQWGLQQIVLPVHLDLALAFLDDGADAGWRQYPAKPVAACADTLDQRALRHKLDGDLLRD